MHKLSNLFKNSHGNITLVILIAVVIAGSIYLVGGVVPHLEQIDTGEQGRVVVPDLEDTEGGSDSASLRLKTIKFKQCTETAAVDFMLDRSGSMKAKTPSGETKIQALKDAVILFIDNLSDNSVIGIQYFSSRGIGNLIEINEKQNIGNYAEAINALPADGNTPTHDALAYSYARLQNGVQKYPDRDFAFIFVSDGQPVPNTQDPRLFNPNPADQIKNLGVEVYSIGILDSNQIRSGQMKELLTDIASSPDNVYISPNGEDLDKIIASISQDLCQKAN